MKIRMLALIATLVPAVAGAQTATPAPATPTKIDASAVAPQTVVYSITMSGMPVAEMTRTVTRETKDGKDVVKSHGVATGMQNMTTDLLFEAKTFKPISASMTGSAQGQEFSSLLSVADGRISGMLKMPMQPDPTMVDAAFPEGAILGGMEEFAIWVTDFAVGKELTVNMYNAQTGSVTPITMTVTGESKQKVAAGEFDVYELEMKNAQGSMKGYIRKAAPHIIVKQTMSQAPVVIELKEIK